jgi:putative transposase
MLITKKIKLEVSTRDAATLEFMQAKCRKELVILDERDTSKMCSGREHLQAMPLWKRTYKCPKCGLVMDRDENSAVNILTRYLARQGPHTPLAECGVLQDDGLDVAGTGPAQVA